MRFDTGVNVPMLALLYLVASKLFFAMMYNVYGVPFARPVILNDAFAPSVANDVVYVVPVPVLFALIEYVREVAPPKLEGTLKLIIARKLPTVEYIFVGAPGFVDGTYDEDGAESTPLYVAL